jgi:hypothetical protein
MSEPLTCNDCNTPAVLKISKAQKAYYDCPNCPSNNPAYKSKFLTFLDRVDEYKKKKSSPRQDCNPCEKVKEVVKEKVAGKRKPERDDNTESKRLKAMADDMEAMSKRIAAQIAQTDLLLARVEMLLASPQSDQETEEELTE